MANIEKVINGFDKCNPVAGNCDKCPYKNDDNTDCVGELMRDALELLKEKKEKWNFFSFRKMTEEEVEYYKDLYELDDDNCELIENVPGDGEEVLLWTGYGFTVDTYDDGMFEGVGEIEKGMAWRYLPKPPKDGEQDAS